MKITQPQALHVSKSTTIVGFLYQTPQPPKKQHKTTQKLIGVNIFLWNVAPFWFVFLAYIYHGIKLSEKYYLLRMKRKGQVPGQPTSRSKRDA